MSRENKFSGANGNRNLFLSFPCSAGQEDVMPNVLILFVITTHTC